MRLFLVGAVASLAGGGIFSPWAAFVNGAIAGLFYFGLGWILSKGRFIDDPCEALLIFGVAGMVGTVNVSFLDPVEGIIYGNNTKGIYFGL